MAKEKPIYYVSDREASYPARLRSYTGMPAGLYVRGTLPGDEPTVAIVGARACSVYGARQAARFGRELARNGVTVISGLAEGIDAEAQLGALSAGGRSFGVLGCGVDICYPCSSRVLYDKLPLKGGLLSEYEPGSPPVRWHFPVRNRLISALADIVLVIEARQRSGSLITVDYALEQGKTVFALPGRVGDALSEGCHALIAQGAGIALSPQAVLDELETIRQCRGAAFSAGQPALPVHHAAFIAGQPATAVARPALAAPQPTLAGSPGDVRRSAASFSKMKDPADEKMTRDMAPTPLTTYRNGPAQDYLSPEAVTLKTALSDEPMSLDALAEKAHLEGRAARGAMSELMLLGEAAELFPQMFALAERES
ncbi:MAG: DNA-processing protein DprA [Lachnospiraceae bacterium]|nr:DNA-processing protein DprA [Lachnospiraceae bacterium]